ncbi:major membrane immunogen (membrane-anchored lipoprotein) [Kitasatospora sp. GAS204A]|uniref:SurA N-terminal domain-containing protein n=1 Tax=unclassified Kitasatospora TaxID=2633591 RepID=UPI002476FC0B|nr:SurA N-terminal domain-containing protein [Kitasatospora sp. GAS204B]MDH6116661.1 major membrane immunogen (membrane-anchored lipoprotein) [Kitasatospora sp. GAS204B]
MIRSHCLRRTPAAPARPGPRRVLPAVGALLAAALLTACGGRPLQAGAAAVVGPDRITEAAVQARVAEFRAQAARLPSGQYQEQAGLVGATVSGMIFSEVVAQALAEHRLTVSDTEVAQARSDQAQAWGGEAGLEQMLLLKHAVPAREIDNFHREQIGLQKLAALGGRQIGTTDGNKTVHQLLAEAAAQLKVTVNPRYGSWDAQQAVLDSPSEDWLPQSGAAA